MVSIKALLSCFSSTHNSYTNSYVQIKLKHEYPRDRFKLQILSDLIKTPQRTTSVPSKNMMEL